MHEPNADPDDLAIKALFAAAPINDDGFTSRVTASMRRKLWARRLIVPMATLLGLAIAVRPALELLTFAIDRAGALSALFPGMFSSSPSYLTVISLVTVTAVLAMPMLTVFDD